MNFSVADLRIASTVEGVCEVPAVYVCSSHLRQHPCHLFTTPISFDGGDQGNAVFVLLPLSSSSHTTEEIMLAGRVARRITRLVFESLDRDGEPFLSACASSSVAKLIDHKLRDKTTQEEVLPTPDVAERDGVGSSAFLSRIAGLFSNCLPVLTYSSRRPVDDVPLGEDAVLVRFVPPHEVERVTQYRMQMDPDSTTTHFYFERQLQGAEKELESCVAALLNETQ